jgi:hypothetical protein
MLHLPLLLTVLTLPPSDTARTVAAQALGDAAAPAIDGRLDEAAWAAAEPATGFVQQQPEPGAPASQRTEARVLYDGDALYVGMRMYDTRPDSIAAQLARRDAFRIYSDWAHVVLDSYNDNRTAFRFSVNPRGVKKDVFHFDDGNEDLSWDAVWDVATRVDSLGWTAEYRIPLSQLRFTTSGAEQVWGINFGREIARADERVYWSQVQPNTDRYVSFAGTLRGLRGLRAPQRLEIQPYALSRYTREPPATAAPGLDAEPFAASLGADLKYGLTSDLTLTATVNPDFGQVEADPSEVNLTEFESFFGERRPFFTEGSDIFRVRMGQVDVNGNELLFYSRRIGRAPQRRLPSRTLVEAPEATTILGAAKLSGKTRGGWSVGILDAVTAPERARVLAGRGDSLVTVEPLTNYAVARVSRDFRQGRSALGGVLTATNRRIAPGSGLHFLREQAYVGGLTGRHRFGGDYEVSGGVLASHIAGSPRAIQLAQLSSARLFQRPDAEHVELDSTRTSLSGAAANVVVEKSSGGHWRWVALGSVRTPGFETNDLGYQRLADAGSVIGGVAYVQSGPGPVFRNWSVGADAGSSWTWGGERFLTAGVLRGNAQLHNLWQGFAQAIRFLPALSPTTLRGGPALYTPARTALVTGVNSDPRKRVRLNLFSFVEMEDGTGGYTMSLNPEVSLRPSSRASLSLTPAWSRNVSAWQYLGEQGTPAGPRYLGGELEQTTVSLTTRLSYSFTPDLSLQLYAQPFVSAVDFADLRTVAAPRAERFDARFRPAEAAEPDFSVKELRSNAVLRWEYRPGSTLFLVWSQGREQRLDDGTFGLSRDFGRLFGLDERFPVPATNVLLLKVSYWLGR